MKQRVALGALAAGTLAVAVAVWAPWSGGGTHVHAVFASTLGLVDGAEVRSGGLHVGKVDGIRLGADGYPHVTLALDSGYRVRQGAEASVRLASLSGEANRFVSLTEGTGPDLPDGATLGLARTQSPVEVEDVLATLDPRTRRDVRGVLGGLAASLRRRGPDIERTLAVSAGSLQRTAAVLGDLDSDGVALRDAVGASQQVLGALAAHPGTTAAAADRTAALLSATARSQRAIAASLAGLPGGLHSGRAAAVELERAVPPLRTLVRAAAPGARELVPAAGELRRLVQQAKPALRDARGLVATAPADLRAARPLLRDARPVVEKLDPTLAKANPMLDEIRARTPDFFSFFANWADFTSNYDANGHAARVGIVFPPAPLNTVGPSDDDAGHLRAPFVRTPGVLAGEPWTSYKDSFAGSGG